MTSALQRSGDSQSFDFSMEKARRAILCVTETDHRINALSRILNMPQLHESQNQEAYDDFDSLLDHLNYDQFRVDYSNFLENRSWESLIKKLNKELDPKNPDVKILTLRARTHLNLNQTHLARKDLERIFSIKSSFAPAYDLQKKLNEKEDEIKKTINSLDSSSYSDCLTIASLLLHLGSAKRATQIYTMAERLALREGRSLSSQLYSARAWCHLCSKNLTAARRDAERAMEINPLDEDLKSLFQLLETKERAYHKALPNLAMDPEDSSQPRPMAICKYSGGSGGLAESETVSSQGFLGLSSPWGSIEGHLILEVKNHLALMSRADADLFCTLMKQVFDGQHPSAALYRLNLLRERAPRNPCLFLLESFAHLQLKQKTEAVTCLLKAEELAPQFSYLSLVKAEILMESSVNEDLASARDVFSRLIQAHPEEASHLLPRRAQCSFQLGDLELAEKDVEKALQGNAGNAEARAIRSLILIEQDDLEAAADEFDWLQNRPQIFQSVAFSAIQTYQKIGRYKEAFWHLDSLIEREPKNPLLRVLRLQVELEKAHSEGDDSYAFSLQKITEKLSDLLQEYPQCEEGHRLLAALYFNQSYLAKSCEEYDWLEKNAKDFSPYALLAANAHHYAGNNEKALRILNELLEIQPRDLEAHKLLCWVHYYLGDLDSSWTECQWVDNAQGSLEGIEDVVVDLSILLHKYEEGLRVISKILEKQPTHSVMIRKRGAIYLAQKNISDCLRDYETALRLSPPVKKEEKREWKERLEEIKGYCTGSSDEDLQARGDIERLLGNDEEALHYYDGHSGAKKDPQLLSLQVECLMNLPEFSEKRKRIEEWATRLQEAEKESPGNAPLLRTLGKLYMKFLGLKHANAYFEKYLQLEPHDMQVRLWKASVQFRRHLHEEGIIECDQALDIDPLNPGILTLKGTQLLKKEDRSLAEEYLRQVVQLQPTNAPALKGLWEIARHKAQNAEGEKEKGLHQEQALGMLNQVLAAHPSLESARQCRFFFLTHELTHELPLKEEYRTLRQEQLTQTALEDAMILAELTKDPKRKQEFLLRRGDLLRTLERREEAIEEFDRVLALSEVHSKAGKFKHCAALTGKAECLFLQGELQEAEKLIEEVFKLVPHYSPAILLRCWIREEQGKQAEGKELLKEAVELFPDDPDLLENLQRLSSEK